MKIRQADAADSLTLSLLSMDVQRLHAENHPEIFRMPQKDDYAVAFFDGMLADPLIRIFITEENGQVLGYVLCKLIEREENPFTLAMRYLLVDQISVKPEAQGKGAGTALIKQAEMLAKDWNVSRVQLDSWGFNVKAHAFFEKMGFEKFNYRFWHNL